MRPPLQDLPDTARVVIFANTKRRVDYLQKGLWDEGLGTCSIHGDKQQSERDQALKMFVAGERPLMIATDVAGGVVLFLFPLSRRWKGQVCVLTFWRGEGCGG